jgi:hypothetical protein
VDRLDRQHVEVVPPLPAAAHDGEQPGPLEHAEVLHHRAAVEVGDAGTQVGGGARPVAQQVEEPAAHRRGEGLERRVQPVVRHML